MASFESAIVQVTSSVGTTPTIIFNPANTSSTTFGPCGSVPATASFNGLVVANTGTVSLYLSSGSIATSTTFPYGLIVPSGGEAYLSGYSGTVGVAGTVWAQTGALNTTGAAQVGLPSVASVI